MVFTNGIKYKVILTHASKIVLKMKNDVDTYVFQPSVMQKKNMILTFFENNNCTIDLNLSDKLSLITITFYINSIKTGALINKSNASIRISSGYVIESQVYFCVDNIGGKLYLGRIELELYNDNFRILREYLKENTPNKKIEL